MVSVTEVWKPVVGHETKFEVSNHGRVKALPCFRRHWCGRNIPQPERFVTLTRHSGGYLLLNLGCTKKEYVHRVVMRAFVGEGHGLDVNHIDGDKTNNCLENLEYCDRLHNVRHAIATGLQDNSGENNGMAKATREQVVKAYELVASGVMTRDAARQTGLTASNVSLICTGGRWGLKPLPRRQSWRWTDAQLARVRSMSRDGMRPVEISELTGIPLETVRRHARRALNRPAGSDMKENA